MKRYLPLFFNVEGKNILIVGGGRVAYQKIKALKKFTSNIFVVAPNIIPQIEQLKLHCTKKKYSVKDLLNKHLIYACTNNDLLNRKIKNDAHKMKQLVNVADDRAKCDFISPAVLIKGYMTVAVSSNGLNTKKAVKWRNKINGIMNDD